MDDLTAMLNQVMSDPEAMRQIQSIASSLGLGGESNSAPPSPPPQQQTYQPDRQGSGGGADLSALAALLQNAQQPAPAPAQNSMPDLSALSALLGGSRPQPAPAPAGPDLSSLAGILGGLGSGGASPTPDLSSLAGILGGLGSGGAPSGGSSGLSALTSLLNGGSAPQKASPGILPGIDVGIIMKLSQAMASIQSNRANVDLLMALKPRLKSERSKKVDDAVRVMQLIQFLPLIKESGLFGEMDGILGNLTGSGGGLGGLLGNVGNSLGGLLGGLGRR